MPDPATMTGTAKGEPKVGGQAAGSQSGWFRLCFVTAQLVLRLKKNPVSKKVTRDILHGVKN